MSDLNNTTEEAASAIASGIINEQAVVDALQHYLRQSALTQRAHLPRWASW